MKQAFTDSNGGYYETEEQGVPAWAIGMAPCEVRPPVSPPEPSPIEKIRALEQQYADKQARITRQSLLILALDKAMALPQAAGMSRDEVHAVLMASDQGYAAIYNLEQQIEALRSQL